MADKKSHLTSYDRKFIAAIVFVNFSLTMLVVSLFGLYYYEKEIDFKAYVVKMEKRLTILRKIAEKYDENLKLRGMEWDYSQKEGIGAELVPEDKTKKGK